MTGRAGWDAGGRVGFDPSARRRVRRAGARARPLLLPAAVLLAAGVVAQALAPEPAPPVAPATATVPDGSVLVAVQPAEPAVLPLAVPGSLVDVYAADAAASLDPLGGGEPAPARLVVRGGLVVPPPVPAASALVGAAGSLAVPGEGGTGTAVTLLVTHDEAAALAARPGGALLLAVRGTPGPTSPQAARPP